MFPDNETLHETEVRPSLYGKCQEGWVAVENIRPKQNENLKTQSHVLKLKMLTDLWRVETWG